MGTLKTWEEIRSEFPNRFVLLTHCQEKRKDERRVVVVAGEIVFTSLDGQEVYQQYRRLGMPSDATFGHTSHMQLEIEEIPFLGLHPSA